MVKRQSGCPLCGARVSALEWINACAELIEADLGVLSACCPYCQGEIEIRPEAGRINLGYCLMEPSPHFEAVLTLPYDDLDIEASANRRVLVLACPDGRWEFSQ